MAVGRRAGVDDDGLGVGKTHHVGIRDPIRRDDERLAQLERHDLGDAVTLTGWLDEAGVRSTHVETDLLVNDPSIIDPKSGVRNEFMKQLGIAQ